MNTQEIAENIETWINEENDPRFKIGKRGQYDGKNNTILLEIIYSYQSVVELPISIVKPESYKNKIGVFTGVEFDDEQARSFHSLETQFKNNFLAELSRGLMLMNLGASLSPNKDKFNRIEFQEFVYLDGISRDRMVNAIQKISMAYSYVVSVFNKHKITQRGFDPSDLI